MGDSCIDVNDNGFIFGKVSVRVLLSASGHTRATSVRVSTGGGGASCRKGVHVQVQLEMAPFTFSVLAEPEIKTEQRQRSQIIA